MIASISLIARTYGSLRSMYGKTVVIFSIIIFRSSFPLQNFVNFGKANAIIFSNGIFLFYQ